MNVAGPSRARLAPRERVESTYEEDLLGVLGQLTLEDIDEMQAFYARAGNRLTDNDVAMNDLLQQARALAVLDEDRVLAQRIAAGEDVVVDQRPAQRPAVVPQPTGNRATQQHGIQQRAGQAARNNAAPTQTWGGWISSVVEWMFAEPQAPVPVSVPTTTPRTPVVPVPASTNVTTTTPKTPVVNRPTGHDCVICQDPIFGAEIRAPCGHYYGIDCVTDLFQSATRDETLFPPRCCRQNIPLTQVQPHLSQAVVTTFQQKQVEFTTLKRVYCSAPTCSHFLGPLSEGAYASKVYTCPAPGCTRRTCGKCREQHSGDWTHACRPDADAAQVLELGRTAGWARCPGCSQMIELNIGCFHMTCRCRTEFCYVCRARWKTCPCPQWDERRLLAAAEARVDAQLGVDRERGARRDVPAQWAPPVPAAVPVNRAPAPAARLAVPAPPLPAVAANRVVPAPRLVVPVPLPPPVPANRVAPTTRPAVPVPLPPPVPAPRPVPPPAPARPAAPARFVPPVQPPTVNVRYPQHTPARTPTASTSGRPTYTPSTPAQQVTSHRVASLRDLEAMGSTSASASSSTGRPAYATSTPAQEATSHTVASLRDLMAGSTAASASSSTRPTQRTNYADDDWSSAATYAPARTTTNTGTSTSAASGSTKRLENAASTSAQGATNGADDDWWRSAAPMIKWTNTGVSTSASASASAPSKIYSTDPKRQRLVQEMMERLREDHECDHTQWRYRHGGGICQTCGQHLPVYLLRCKGCEVLACKRCRFNRF